MFKQYFCPEVYTYSGCSKLEIYVYYLTGQLGKFQQSVFIIECYVFIHANVVIRIDYCHQYY